MRWKRKKNNKKPTLILYSAATRDVTKTANLVTAEQLSSTHSENFILVLSLVYVEARRAFDVHVEDPSSTCATRRVCRDGIELKVNPVGYI